MFQNSVSFKIFENSCIEVIEEKQKLTLIGQTVDHVRMRQFR